MSRAIYSITNLKSASLEDSDDRQTSIAVQSTTDPGLSCQLRVWEQGWTMRVTYFLSVFFDSWSLFWVDFQFDGGEHSLMNLLHGFCGLVYFLGQQFFGNLGIAGITFVPLCRVFFISLYHRYFFTCAKPPSLLFI